MTHTVRTSHIQRLIENGLDLARRVDGHTAHRFEGMVGVQADQRIDGREDAPIADVLEKAIGDLRHAADELEAERNSCMGWRQV